MVWQCILCIEKEVLYSSSQLFQVVFAICDLPLPSQALSCLLLQPCEVLDPRAVKYRERRESQVPSNNGPPLTVQGDSRK